MSLLGPGLTFQKGPWKTKKNEQAPVQKFPWKGGGVAGGGERHAGHGNWMSVMNPQTFPMTFPQPTSEPSKYASIVTIHDIYESKLNNGPPGSRKAQAQRTGQPMPGPKLSFGHAVLGNNENGVLRNARDEQREELLQPPLEIPNTVAPPLTEINSTVTNPVHEHVTHEHVTHEHVTNINNVYQNQEAESQLAESLGIISNLTHTNQTNTELASEFRNVQSTLNAIHQEMIIARQGQNQGASHLLESQQAGLLQTQTILADLQNRIEQHQLRIDERDRDIILNLQNRNNVLIQNYDQRQQQNNVFQSYDQQQNNVHYDLRTLNHLQQHQEYHHHQHLTIGSSTGTLLQQAQDTIGLERQIELPLQRKRRRQEVQEPLLLTNGPAVQVNRIEVQGGGGVPTRERINEINATSTRGRTTRAKRNEQNQLVRSTKSLKELIAKTIPKRSARQGNV